MYYDLLTKIKNAEMAKKESITVPFSKFDFAVLGVLQGAGYVEAFEKKSVGKKNFIEVRLRYVGVRPALSEFRIISKPSRRQYAGTSELRPVRQNSGIAVVSTSSGVMSGREAKKKNLGGEYLFQVW